MTHAIDYICGDCGHEDAHDEETMRLARSSPSIVLGCAECGSVNWWPDGSYGAARVRVSLASKRFADACINAARDVFR